MPHDAPGEVPHRYLFHDLRTNALRGEVPLAQLGYNPQQLNGDGTFDATLPVLGDDLATDLAVLDATEPDRRVLYVERDRELVYAGIVWSRTFDSEAGAFTIGGSEPSSYLRRRRWTLATRTYVNVSDRTVFTDLVNDAMSGYASAIGLTPVVPAGAGNLRSRTFVAAELNPIAANISGLAEEWPGFEWANEVGVDASGAPVKRLVLSDPYRGRSATQSGLVWEYPGNILKYTWPEDGGSAANFVWGLGRAAATNLDLLAYSMYLDRMTLEGYPLLEDVLQASDVGDTTQLQRMTDSERLRRDAPVVLPTITVSATAEPMVGDYLVGDRARVYIDDRRRFPSGFDGVLRVVSQHVDVSATGKETVVLTMLPWPSATT